MTQEEKQLLFKDLCARLPYGVKISYWKPGNGHDAYVRSIGALKMIDARDDSIWLTMQEGPYFYTDCIETSKPYLRSMSSMTEEEKEELKEEHKKDERIYVEVIERIANGDEHARGTAVPHFAVDWCNEHHFDFRGLIPMGLALEVKDGMYND